MNYANASLALLDAGTPNERYTFTTTVQKSVFPSFNVECFYNDTLFMADLYTSKAKSYPPSAASSSSSSPSSTASATTSASATPSATPFANWRFAVDATLHIGGGVDVPVCYAMNNGQPGARVTSGYSVMPSEDFCSCAYKNYDP